MTDVDSKRSSELDPEESSDKFFADRSHKNAVLAYDIAKAAGQAVILINGGAATAMLAFLSKQDRTLMHDTGAYSLLLYALGAGAGALMLYTFYLTNHNWNIFWQVKHFYNQDNRWAKNFGRFWRVVTHVVCLASFTLFVWASVLLACSFLQADATQKSTNLRCPCELANFALRFFQLQSTKP
jgi:hypothetical protein